MRASIAIHKLTSCSGCQSVILNLGDDLLVLSRLVEIRHFIEAGLNDFDADVDIAFVEGSITTPEDEARILKVRERARFLVAIGACACSGGVQALRNVKESGGWAGAVYANTAYLDSLAESRSVAQLVKVDLELWGCPISGRQLIATVRALLQGVPPVLPTEKVCQECKRAGNVCVLVSRAEPCLGPVTRAGCGALCPSFGAPCYTCFGASEQPNCEALGERLVGLGIPQRQVAERFVSISSGLKPYQDEWQRLRIPAKQVD
ncbi:sulfhydrogenase subunit delta [Marinobacterium nitratireducens]|uniref:Sulfhydrogenase subunit delta n=1 Tax=Marinobacterium nitratireducens TaxID=518897 RepID=A0A918DWL5_9GAMM|nr:sulfhydrogenase subunit delta [Marinobacterium nitratireducens]GGO86934.1 sulfhydrogenase subunit delta [Marinobacterium nitratireducens]